MYLLVEVAAPQKDKVVVSGADFNLDADFQDMNTSNPKTVKVAGAEGVGYMKQLLYEEQVLSKAAREGNVQTGQKEYDQYVMGGKISAPAGSMDDTFGFVQTAHGFTVNGIDDYAKKNLNVISQGNREMNTAEGFVITVEKVGQERQVGLYLTGTVNIRNTKLAGAQGGVQNPAKPGSKAQVVQHKHQQRLSLIWRMLQTQTLFLNVRHHNRLVNCSYI